MRTRLSFICCIVFDKVSLLGESEYWFAMIKVVMIVLFIIVGLIYDWGGIKGHPGPVGPFIVLTRTFSQLNLLRRVYQILKTAKLS